MRMTEALAAANCDGKIASCDALARRPHEPMGTISTAERLGLLRRLTRLTRNADAAEDCLQSAFVRLEEYRLHTSIDNIVGFLAHAARNIAIDEARKSRVRAASGNVVELRNCCDERPLQDEVLVARERLARARATLIALPERTRTVFLMHRFSRAKYRDIAIQLGISVSAVEKHIARASVALANSRDRENGDASPPLRSGRARPHGPGRAGSVSATEKRICLASIEEIEASNVNAATGCGDAV